MRDVWNRNNGRINMKELSVVEQLMYTTTRVECVDKSGRISVATAFFCKLYIDQDRFCDVLVSNRHVFENLREIIFHITLATKGGAPTTEYKDYHLVLGDKSNSIILHPDKDVDLAIMLIHPILIEMHQRLQRTLFYKSITDAQIANLSDEKYDALEEVIMIGYPVGLWDNVNNRPLFRRGITATDPKVDYQGKPMFLIDCACIQGSSGSPVFALHKGYLTDKHGKPLNQYGATLELLGIQSAMPVKSILADLTYVERTAQKPVANVQIPINLGYVVKAEKLKEFIPIIREIVNAAEKMLKNLPQRN